MNASREPAMVASPHDALVREIFAKPAHAAVELRAALPPEVFAQLDLATLRVEAGTLIDDLDERRTDVLYSVQISGQPGFVYVLFEHQSSVDPIMPFRMLEYVTRILSRHVNRGGGLPLPVVLPILLHHSKSGWTASTEVSELFAEPLRRHPELAPYVPRLRFFLDDISHASDGELLARASFESGKIPALVYLALRDSRDRKQVVRTLLSCVSELSEAFRTEDGKRALMTVLRYLSAVRSEISRDELLAIAERATPEAKEELMTLAEQWMAEGEARGIAKGIAKGEARGIAKGEARGIAKGEARGQLAGERRLLEKQLLFKFGELSAAQAQRLQDASTTQLEEWGQRVLTAVTLDDVFAEE